MADGKSINNPGWDEKVAIWERIALRETNTRIANTTGIMAALPIPRDRGTIKGLRDELRDLAPYQRVSLPEIVRRYGEATLWAEKAPSASEIRGKGEINAAIRLLCESHLTAEGRTTEGLSVFQSLENSLAMGIDQLNLQGILKWTLNISSDWGR